MNKQIEEMYQDFLDYKEKTLCKVFSYKGMCENFFKLGYQKINEDSIVVDKEYLKKELQGLELQARQETAREILDEVGNIQIDKSMSTPTLMVIYNKLKEIAKRYGLEE